jgi:type I restriction enzyme M protein
MIWIAPSEKDHANAALGRRLWDAADQFRANSGLNSQESSVPVLGLLFLRFAEARFGAHESPRATKLYDRTSDELTFDEIERVAI